MGSIANQSYFWPVFFASIGGAVIVFGLVLELLAEKKWFKNLRSMQFWNCAKTWGEWLVIIGIVVEVVDAGSTALELYKNNPHHLPIESIAVNQVRVEILGEDADDPNQGNSEIAIGHFDSDKTNINQVFLPGHVSVRSIQGIHGGRNLEYRLDFDGSAFQAFLRKPIIPDEVNAVSVQLPLKFGKSAIIVDGKIEIIMNGTIKKSFLIPLQTNSASIATSLCDHEIFVPIPLHAGW